MTHLDRLKNATAIADRGFSTIQPLCLEPRFMFDAAGAATGAEAAQDAQAQAEAASAADGGSHDGGADTIAEPGDTGGIGAGGEAANDADGNQTSDEAITPDAIPATSTQQPHQIALIDTTIDGYETLAAGFSADVTVITFQSDGSLSQIADLLSSYGQVDAIHLVSHGAIGAINLGGTIIDTADLADQSEALTEIGSHLTETGDILLYGCDVGGDQRGMAFVDAMANLTGADVAASNDATGSADMGGDWNLEVSSGTIEASVALSEASQHDFTALLVSSETYDNLTSEGYGIDTGITTVDFGEWTYSTNHTTSFVVGEDDGYTIPSSLTVDGSGTDKVLEINGPYVSQNTNPLTITVEAKDSSSFTLTSLDLGIVQAPSSERGVTVTVYNGLTVLGTFVFDLATSSSGDGITYVANTDADEGSSTGHFTFDGTYANATSFELAMSGAGTYQIDNIIASPAASNAAPVVGTSGGSVSYTENGTGTVVDTGFTVTDNDNATLSSATISITGGFTSGQDVLSFANGGSFGNITGSYDSSNGVLTLTSSGSTASVAQWQDAIRSITYSNSSDAPSEADRTVSISVNDGTADSNTATKTVTVTAVNDAPSSVSATDSNVSGFPINATFTEDTSGQELDLTSIDLVDPDSGSSELILTLVATSGTFSIANDPDITWTGNGTGTITLTGTLTALNNYINSASNIWYQGAQDASGTGEKISVYLDDASTTSNLLGDINLTITPVNDSPEATAPTDVSVVTDTESNLDLSGLSFSDVDNTSLTVTLTLSAGTFSNPTNGSGVGSGVTATLVSGTEITLAGNIADINTYLDTASNIKYTTALGQQGDNIATITVKANDGALNPTVATINIDATDPNDAPVLTPSNPDLTGIDENATTNGGQTVGSFLSGSVSDADTGALSGIAISGLSSGNGKWQYSLDNGSSWVDVGTVAEGSALLLRSTDYVRFVPNGDTGTSASISYHAWDQTGGNSAGDKVSVSSTGGTTAFSTATDTASIDVSEVNDAPTISGVPTDVTVVEDTASNFDLSAITFGDVDDSSLTVTITASAGTFAASTSGGVTVGGTGSGTLTLSGTVSAINTWLDTASNIQYTGAANASGDNAATFSVTANDGAVDSTVANGNIDITDANDAPVLTPSTPDLTGIDENATTNGGQTVGSFLSGSVSDADTGALSGIAISGLSSGNGKWQYSLDNGSSWVDVGTVAEASALLLRSTDYVRFVPNGDTGTSASISYHAWDQTGGNSAGDKVSVSSTGGTTAFSTATDTASIDVSEVNDAPTISGVPTDVTVVEDTASNFDLSAITFGDVDDSSLTVTITASAGTFAASTSGGVTVGGTGSGTLTLSGTVSAINTWLDTASNIQYTGAANASGDNAATFSVTANDGAVDSTVANGNIDITGTNDAPTLTDGASVALTGTNEDTTSSGTTVSSILTGAGYSDIDAGASSGIAITGMTGNGKWQYSTDGANWVDIGSASASAAVLLTSTSQVRYIPDGNNGETANLTFKAWDQTTGSASTTGSVSTADTGTSGGGSAFSSQNASASMVVSNVNDAPTISGVPTDVTVVEDTASNFDLSAITFGDVDDSSLIVTITASAGTFAASTSGGVTVGGTGSGTLTLSGTVSAINTWLDTASNIQYTGAANASGDNAATFSVTANDGAVDSTVANGNIDITGTNDAPVLTPSNPDLTGIDENATTNGGQTVGSFLSGSVSDADTGALSGIAISGLSSGNGKWQYSLDNGSSWVDVGTVAEGSALLLRSTDYVRFVPNGDTGTSASISYHAWDQTGGNSAGDKVSVSSTGGTTAFSTATDTASIDVSEVNDAPTISGVPTDVTVVEDTASNFDLSAITFGDVDDSSLTVTITASAGTFAASSSGGVTVGGTGSGTLTLSGTVSAINTWLDTASNIQYMSAADASGDNAATFSVTADDGAVDSTVANGNIDITGTNDAPVLTPSNPDLTGIDENATTNGGQTVGSFLSGSVSDADTGALSGIAISGLSSGNGKWQYSLDNGSSWVDVGTVAEGSALLLRSTDYVRFVPNGDTATSASISYHAWDQTGGNSAGDKVSVNSTGGTTAFSTATDTASIDVSEVNDAPTISGVPTDVTVVEDTAGNFDLSAITFGDVDDSSLTVTITASAGTFAASTSGGVTVGGTGSGTLTLSGTVSAINTWLDTASNIQYTGAANASGDNAATFSVTANDGVVDSTVANGNIDITGTNDAPTLTDGASVALTGTNEDTTSSGTTVSSILSGAGYSDIDAGASSGIAITGMTGNGKWQYSADGTNWVDIGSASASAAVLLTSTSQVRYIPDGNNGETANLTFKAWDQTTGSASTTGSVSTADTGTSGGGSAFSSQNASASMVVSNVNDAPTAPASLPGTIIENGGPMSYVVSVAGFNDIDGDNLSFTATLADGSALPAWLSYSVNGSNVTFSGNVPGDFIGDLEVRITATEDATAHLTASSNLTIQVEARPVVVVTPPASPPEPAPVPPVMSPPGTGNIGDAGTPVGSALDFGGRNGGEIVQPVTGQLGSLSPLDNSSTPVMAGLQSTTPPSIFGDTAGQTIFGGDVGAGTGILAGRTQLITSQGAGLGNDAGFEPANGNGEGTGTDEGAAGTPNLDGAAQNGGGDNGNASNGNGSAAAGAGNAPNEEAQPERAAPADAQNNGEGEASPASENPGGDGDVAPEGNDNIQGALDNPALPSFVFKEAVLANADFTDQLAGAGGAFERHASALAKALSDFDASAA